MNRFMEFIHYHFPKFAAGIYCLAIFLSFGSKTCAHSNIQQETVWQLAFWANQEPACNITVKGDGIPSSFEIEAACGKEIANLWYTTPACSHPFFRSENVNDCSGLFLRKIWQKQVSDPDQQNMLETKDPLFFIRGCEPSDRCNQLPVVIFQNKSSDRNDPSSTVRIKIGTFEGECAEDDCQMELPITSEEGQWVEFWSLSPDGIQGVHDRFKYRAAIVSNSSSPIYQFDLISTAYPEAAPFCSDIWQVFPQLNLQNQKIYEAPFSSDFLTTTFHLSILAGKIITHGLVDTSHCNNYGLMSDGSANGCGEKVSADMIFTMQNQYNDLLFESGIRNHVPPRIIKGMIAQESQFWPYSEIDNEYGLGMITENGIDLLLRWNTPYYMKLCKAVFPQKADRCEIQYSELPAMEQQLLRGSALQKIGTYEEIDLLGAVIRASAAQVNQIIQNITGSDCEHTASYEDLWKFTIANYYSGSGCIQNAMRITAAYQYALSWDHVQNFLSGICNHAKAYVENVYVFGNL
jgi:hypothetical protein